MPQRTNISSGAPWEDLVGYSRAVRIGNVIEVSGTTAVDGDGNVVGPEDPFEQTRFILKKIEGAIVEAGGTMEDVVRTRLFVTDISRWEEVGRAHAECFGTIRPVSTLVEVPRLIDTGLMVEIEATAIVL